MGMHWDQALQTYTLLTVGDGIVTQLPALVIAVSTGLIVTRSASDGNLSLEVLRQITSFPKTLLMVIAVLTGLLFMPGIPIVPVLLIMAILVGVLLFVRKRAAEESEKATEELAEKDASEPKDTYDLLQVDPIEVLVGATLAPLVNGEQSIFTDRIAAIRKQYALDSGMVLPRVRFRDAPQLGANAYEINLFGVMSGRGEILVERTLAIQGGSEVKGIKGIETREPTYGLPAIWIEEAEKENARKARYTLVDPATVFITHLSEVLKQQSATLLTRVETERLLQRVRQNQPGLVEDLIPTVLSIGDVQKVLQHLLREKVSIRNLEAIVETLADMGRNNKDLLQLTEAVRQKLGAAICQSLLGELSALHVLTLDPSVEQTLMQSVRSADAVTRMVVEPKFAEQLLSRLAAQSERMMKGNMLPVLLCSPELRRHMRALSERVIPHMRILSLNEVPNSVSLKSYGTISV
jgi:flagellar biosynthesis protein FlhA